ncbi:hypothetical protein IQ238_16300 [Pleurocapsales cyanobacterium LEGE 06147]|nr:hypothetical protein [Pleurocapsales cyanobacterium LEGE 06147]
MSSSDNSENQNKLIIADTHVHLHNCFDLDIMLDSALENFSRLFSGKGRENNFIGILFLIKIGKQNNNFNQLIQPREKLKNWNFQQTGEKISLYARNKLNQGLFLIAGCQIVSSENLEVLALATDRDFQDGLPLKELIRAIASVDGIPVLPWGVGKWFGRRGKILSNLFNDSELPLFFLGDNSGRPKFWLRPHYFKQAETKGIKILPGTDPLPLPSEVRRPGSFGFKIRADLNFHYPGSHLKQMLLDRSLMIEPYGSLETPFRFIHNQLLIRV